MGFQLQQKSTTLNDLEHEAVLNKLTALAVAVNYSYHRRLQSVSNAATRLVFSAIKSEHITPVLRELHNSEFQRG